MMKRLIVKENVTHQGIGGKEFIIEMEIDKDEVAYRAFAGNWACINFMDRRPDFDCNFPHKLYYGKVGCLGYVVAEDELKEEIPQILIGNNPSYGKTFTQMKELITTINSYDNSSKDNLPMVEHLNTQLQRLSGHSIGTRIWFTGDILHCTVVYPNQQIKELYE